MSRDGAKPLVELARYVRFGVLVHMPYEAIPTLIVLAVHANREGESWPSAGTISLLTGRKVENVYKDLALIQKLGIFDRLGRVNGKGATIFRLRPFEEKRLRKLLSDIPKAGRARKGDATRFKRPALPVIGISDPKPSGLSSPYDSPLDVPMGQASSPCDSVPALPMTGSLDIPVSGREKRLLSGKEKRKEEEVLRGESEGGTPSPPITPPVSLSLGPEKPKTTAREKTADVEEVARFFMTIPNEQWEKATTHFLHKGYPPGLVGQARRMAQEWNGVDRADTASRRRENSGKPLLAARRRLQRKRLDVRTG